MSRTKRIEMMRKRFEWLSKLVKDCNTLEEFSCKFDEYLGIRGIEFRYMQGERVATIYFSFCSNEYETYSIIQNIADIQVSPIVLWQNEVCATEELNILT